MPKQARLLGSGVSLDSSLEGHSLRDLKLASITPGLARIFYFIPFDFILPLNVFGSNLSTSDSCIANICGITAGFCIAGPKSQPVHTRLGSHGATYVSSRRLPRALALGYTACSRALVTAASSSMQLKGDWLKGYPTFQPFQTLPLLHPAFQFQAYARNFFCSGRL